MGATTDLILITGSEDEHPSIGRLNEALAEQQSRFKLRHVSSTAGPVQCDVFMGGCKNLDLTGFLRDFRSIRWECPDQVQLLVREEEDDRFRSYEPYDHGPPMNHADIPDYPVRDIAEEIVAKWALLGADHDRAVEDVALALQRERSGASA